MPWKGVDDQTVEVGGQGIFLVPVRMAASVVAVPRRPARVYVFSLENENARALLVPIEPSSLHGCFAEHSVAHEHARLGASSVSPFRSK